MAKRRAASREGMVVTNVALPKALHRRLAIAAVEDEATLTALVRDAVAEWLERRDVARGKKGRR